MRSRSIIALVSLAVFALVSILLAQSSTPFPETSKAAILNHLPLEQVIFLSESSPITTITENGMAYAVGDVDGRLFKTKVRRGLTAVGLRVPRRRLFWCSQMELR